MAAIINPPSHAHNRKSAMITVLVVLARNNVAMAGVVVIMLMVVQGQITSALGAK
jgi:hypothetical protein